MLLLVLTPEYIDAIFDKNVRLRKNYETCQKEEGNRVEIIFNLFSIMT